jgi:hypothetical protein
VPVVVATNVIEISAGGQHSVVMDENYNVVQWGFLMRGKKDDQNPQREGCPIIDFKPTKIEIDGGAFGIAAGAAHTMAVSSTGEVWSWGGNSSSQLGDNGVYDRPTPYNTLPPNSVATITFEEIMAKKMKGAYDVDDEDEVDLEDMIRGKPRVSPQSAFAKLEDQRSVAPQLLQRLEGMYEDPPNFGAKYPLAYDGCEQKKLSATHAGGFGFKPGSGFGPHSHHPTGRTNLMAMTWGDTPFAMLARQQRQAQQQKQPHSLIVDPVYDEIQLGLRGAPARKAQLSLAGSHSIVRASSTSQLALPGVPKAKTRTGLDMQLAVPGTPARSRSSTGLRRPMDALEDQVGSVDA